MAVPGQPWPRCVIGQDLDLLRPVARQLDYIIARALGIVEISRDIVRADKAYW